jgi:hypothetical protein
MTAYRSTRIATLLLGAALPLLAAAQNSSQPSPLPIPPPLDKELAARASDVTEVTLGKNMLAFAAKFMHDKDEDEDGVRHLIQNLDGIYVREYEFDKEGQYSPDQLDQLRKAFESPEWAPIIREHSRKSGENTEVLMKSVNGESKGLFILSAEPKDLTIVLILGPIRPEELGELHGIAGLGALGDLDHDMRGRDRDRDRDRDKDKEKDKDKDKDKSKNKSKTDGAQ